MLHTSSFSLEFLAETPQKEGSCLRNDQSAPVDGVVSGAPNPLRWGYLQAQEPPAAVGGDTAAGGGKPHITFPLENPRSRG